MPSWPSIRNPEFPLKGKSTLAQLRDEFEAGYVQSRKRDTRGRRRWMLEWKGMPEADFSTLMTFFEANQGGTFTWTNPETSTGYTVRFAEDEIEWSIERPGVRDVKMELEEV